VPALQDRDQPTEVPAVGVDEGGPSDGSESPSGSDGSLTFDCALHLVTCGRDGTGVGDGTDPDATDDPAVIATTPGAAGSDALGEADGDAGTAATLPPDLAPAETTTTTTELQPTTTTTSEPPPTTTTTQPPAPLLGKSAGAKSGRPPPAAILG
jgi:hypothetical protein